MNKLTDSDEKIGKEDPMEELFVDRTEIDKQLLADRLKKYVSIDRKTTTLVPKEAFDKLGAKQKILCYLLYRKALLVTGKVTEEEEAVGAREINKLTGVNYNSVRSYLSQLRGEGLIDMKNGGKYFVPGYSLPKLEEVFTED